MTSRNFHSLNNWEKIKDILWHTTLPLIAYISGGIAVITYMMKNAMLESISSDYVRFAIAKGNTFKKAVLRHCIRNSLIPIATNIGHNISFFISGSFIIETIFNIDGFGLLGYESIIQRDYPVVMGILVISSLLYLIGNIISDVCVALIDPRIKFGK